MEIVIKIDDNIYKSIKNNGCIYEEENEEVALSIIGGTPLPKGHGRLIDEKDLSLMTIHMIDGTLVCDAPTIVEADVESEG